MKLRSFPGILVSAITAQICAGGHDIAADEPAWWIQSPAPGHVFQRRADDTAEIAVSVFDPLDRRFRATVDGSAETAFSKTGHDHVQECVFRHVPVGEHRVTVIGTDDTRALDRIGVGDVHGAIGQSHTSGRSDVLWRSADGRTADPTNLNETAGGSWFPLLSDRLTQERGCPQKFVNCAWGGAPAAFWLPTPHRVGIPLAAASQEFKRAGVKYVMYLIGATDALQNTPKTTYKATVTETVQWLQSQGYTVLLGVMPNAARDDLQNHLPVIQEATREMLREIPGVLPGADLTALAPKTCLNPADKVHLNAEGYRRAVELWAKAYRNVR